MMETIVVVVAAGVALAAGVFIHKWITDKKTGGAAVAAQRIASDAQRILSDAQRDADARVRTADLEAKERTLKARSEFETETRRRERDIQQVEQRILAK